jgi:hypothetical protein
MINYTRTGGRTPPRDREILAISNTGVFRLWRSVAFASDPPTPVGWFGGTLTVTDLTQLSSLATAAQQAGDLSIKPTPGSPIETLQVAGATARIGAYDEPEEPWGSLFEQLRGLLGSLTAAPQAALTVQVDPDGQAARLIHLGAQPLTIDLSELQVRAVLWESYNKQADWQSPADNQGSVIANPGWNYPLPFDHNFTIATGQEVVAYVTCAITDPDQPNQSVPVALQSLRRLS